MPINSRVDKSKDLTMFHCSGEIPLSEIMKVLDTFLKNPTRNSLWVLRNVAWGRITSDWLQKLSLYSAGRARPGGDGKMAIAAPSDVDLGVSRIYEAFAQLNGLAYQVKSFRSWKKAMAWLGSDD